MFMLWENIISFDEKLRKEKKDELEEKKHKMEEKWREERKH